MPTKTLDILGSTLCEHCPAACCRYVALPIDTPETFEDFDDIRWYLMHEGLSIFVEEGVWHLQIQTRCKNLAADNLCGIYQTRPKICRDYEPGNCDYRGGDYVYDLSFTHVAQLERHVQKTLGRGFDSKPPNGRPAAAGRTRRSTTGRR